MSDSKTNKNLDARVRYLQKEAPLKGMKMRVIDLDSQDSISNKLINEPVKEETGIFESLNLEKKNTSKPLDLSAFDVVEIDTPEKVEIKDWLIKDKSDLRWETNDRVAFQHFTRSRDIDEVSKWVKRSEELYLYFLKNHNCTKKSDNDFCEACSVLKRYNDWVLKGTSEE